MPHTGDASVPRRPRPRCAARAGSRRAIARRSAARRARRRRGRASKRAARSVPGRQVPASTACRDRRRADSEPIPTTPTRTPSARARQSASDCGATCPAGATDLSKAVGSAGSRLAAICAESKRADQASSPVDRPGRRIVVTRVDDHVADADRAEPPRRGKAIEVVNRLTRP